MKNLLVGIESVERPGPWYANLANAAGQLSAAFDAYVEVVGVETRPNFRVPSVWDGDWSLIEAMHRQAAQNFTEIYRDVFATGQACSRAIWAGALSHDALGAYARLFDLTLLARPASDGLGPSQAPVESALFLSGRPVLLIPDWSAPIGANVVISWIDTPETARAVLAAMPLLRRAERISLLAIEDARVPSTQAAGAAKALERHGLRVQVAEIRKRGSVGETMLSFAADLKADLLVKGAYTETRLQRFIFGDATDHLISYTALPVLMVH